MKASTNVFCPKEAARELDTPCFYSMMCTSGGSTSRKKSMTNIMYQTGKFLQDSDLIEEEMRTNDGDVIHSNGTYNRIEDSIDTDFTSQKPMANEFDKSHSQSWFAENMNKASARAPAQSNRSNNTMICKPGNDSSFDISNSGTNLPEF